MAGNIMEKRALLLKSPLAHEQMPYKLCIMNNVLMFWTRRRL